MLSRTILVVDDEEDIQELIKLCLARGGYDVLTADTGEQALTMARSRQPTLMVLDLLLPGLSGLDICKILKADPKTQRIPIIILSAKGEESDIVAALELGADDYITKPFNSKVLVARVRRALRRGMEQDLDRSVIHIHGLTIDPSRCEALLNGTPLSLTLSEFNILYVLARRPGAVFTRYQIVDSLHGGDYVVTDRAIDVQIACLRKKLGPCRDYIETVRGLGYRFKGSQRMSRQQDNSVEMSLGR
jgi:two-component system phosphate regulon response regulator PhoB